MSAVSRLPRSQARPPRSRLRDFGVGGSVGLEGPSARRLQTQAGAPPRRTASTSAAPTPLASAGLSIYAGPNSGARARGAIEPDDLDDQQSTPRGISSVPSRRPPATRSNRSNRRLSRPETDEEQGEDQERQRSFARRRSDHLTLPKPSDGGGARPFQLDSSSEEDELEVLQQPTPRANRRTAELGRVDVRPDPLAPLRTRQAGSAASARSPLPAQVSDMGALSRRPSAAAIVPSRRQSMPTVDATSAASASGSGPTGSFATANDAARAQVSFQGIDDLEDQNVSAANVTMSNPRQRLRPSLAGTDGRLDVPTIEERCAVLVINAKGVLSFYMDLQREGWRDDSLDEMLRNWTPFEAYKINQLLAEGQYNHHFIDVNEVLRSLQIDADRQPEGFKEAMNMANCATFVHYVHQLPDNIEAYGELDDGRVTAEVLSRAPLRNISELNDARRIFLRWLVPPEWPLTDEVLTLLLDMSTQVFIHRLQRNVERVQAGTLDEIEAKAVTDNSLNELSSGDIVRHSLQRVKAQRNMSEEDIERAVMRYETFANIRQIDLQELLYDHIVMRQRWPFLRMVSDLTSYIRDVVREVDVGMHSTSLPQIMSRLERESTREASELPDRIGSGSALDADSGDDDDESVRGPSASTPKAEFAVQAGGADAAFASQFPQWMQEMIEEDASRVSRPGAVAFVPEEDEVASVESLTELQKAAAVAELLMADEDVGQGEELAASAERSTIRTADMLPSGLESDSQPLFLGRSSSVDLAMPSSPPGSTFFRAQVASTSRDASGGRLQRNATPSTAVRRSVRATSSQTGRYPLEDLRSEDLGEETVRINSDIRDDVIDSPTKEKASRLGFDDQNRLVRKADGRKGRMLDGSSQAIRESRFDSQGEEDEDIFLENATKKKRYKGKQRAREPTSEAASDAPSASARRSTRVKTRRQAERDAPIKAPTPRKASRSTQVKEEAPNRSTRSTRQRSEELASTQASASNPGARRTRAQARRDAASDAETDVAVKRKTATRPSTIQEESQQAAETNEEPGDIGTARSAVVDGRARATLGGRPEADGAPRSESNPSIDSAQAKQFDGGGPEDIVFDPADLSSNRANDYDDDGGFAGDDDPDVVAQRAARDQRLARRPVRPGIENFHRPRSSGRAVLQFAPADEVERSREAARVTDVLNASSQTPRKRRRIGPFRPEEAWSEISDHRFDAVASTDSRRGRLLARNDDAEEIDELRTPTPPRTTPRPSQGVRVEPYKRSNLYITGGNMVGRQQWTDAETRCLLEALYQIARYKRNKPRFRVYSKVLELHGKNGVRSQTLARWNNVQLKDKSRNELIRMRRERIVIPYWKRLLHPNLWEPKPVRAASHLGTDYDIGEETEEVPSGNESDDDDEDEDDNDDNASNNDQASNASRPSQDDPDRARASREGNRAADRDGTDVDADADTEAGTGMVAAAETEAEAEADEGGEGQEAVYGEAS